MKPASFREVNGKSRLPVAAPTRNKSLIVPVWDLWPGRVQRTCNTRFEFVLIDLACLDKNAIRNTLLDVCITQDNQIRF